MDAIMIAEEYQKELASKLQDAFGVGPIGPAPIIKAMADVAADHAQLIMLTRNMKLSESQWKIVDESVSAQDELDRVLSMTELW